MGAHQNLDAFGLRRKSTNWRARRIWIIAALCVFLAIQCAVDVLARHSGRYAYPTVAMPGFGAGQVESGGRGRVTEREIQVIDAQGTLHSVTPDALLSPMPFTSAIATLDRIFAPSSDAAPVLGVEAVEYLKLQTEQLNMNADPVGLRFTWQPEFLDLNSLQRTPAGDATVREVAW